MLIHNFGRDLSVKKFLMYVLYLFYFSFFPLSVEECILLFAFKSILGLFLCRLLVSLALLMSCY